MTLFNTYLYICTQDIISGQTKWEKVRLDLNFYYFPIGVLLRLPKCI